MQYALQVAGTYTHLLDAAAFASHRGLVTATRDEFEEFMDANAAEADLSGEELERFHRLGITRFYSQGDVSPSDTGKPLDGLGVA